MNAKKGSQIFRSKPSEAGVALLIAIFALLLVGVVAISLIVSSGTESALGSNYRSSASVYYAALAGLENVRGWLSPSSPYYLSTIAAGSGASVPVGQVSYVLNPLSGETVNPTDLSSSNLYADVEYQSEFGVPVTGATVQTVRSVPASAGIPYPPYKWVRINAVTEKTLGIDVNNDGRRDSTTPLYYDGKHLNLAFSGTQALALTSFAVLPNRSQKLMQYVVAMDGIPTFPAAMTILGNGQSQCQIQAQGSTPLISGLDQAPGAPANSGVAGMALNTTTDYSQCTQNGAMNGQTGSLIVGASPYDNSPSVRDASVTAPRLDPLLDPAQGLNTFLNSLIQQANQTFTGGIPDGANLGSCDPSATPPVNKPLITVVSGAGISLEGLSGCGILIVQSSQPQLTLTDTIRWKGLIILQSTGSQAEISIDADNMAIDGALVIIAAPAGQLQMHLGRMNAAGAINYESRWINNAFFGRKAHILSFREINQ